MYVRNSTTLVSTAASVWLGNCIPVSNQNWAPTAAIHPPMSMLRQSSLTAVTPAHLCLHVNKMLCVFNAYLSCF